MRIPKAIADQVRLTKGIEVVLQTAGAVLTIRRKRRRKFTLARLLAKAKGPSPHRHLDHGGPRRA
jgi:antitoxin component of MazEF toxin-antitoxin module